MTRASAKKETKPSPKVSKTIKKATKKSDDETTKGSNKKKAITPKQVESAKNKK